MFLLYWYVANKSIQLRNFFILIVSYIFYGWWDYRFLGLIIFSSSVDFFLGKKIKESNDKKNKKLLLSLSLLVNLGLLGVFKYYNFFVESFIDAMSTFEVDVNFSLIKIILPVGISFYTFQTLSYTIDIFRNKLEPARDVVSFFAFVAFFPQLVAGPIERASNLLGQFYEKKEIDSLEVKEGLRQILWGLFTKVVIADQCAPIVNEIFSNYENYSFYMLTIGAILFAFQIYGDFGGYSNIAIGTARILGFKLMRNFAYPYFSRDIAEFWRRWHISLSTWFRDYLYIPLGGSRGGKLMQFRNVMIIFLVSGFWHGASWNFIIWGGINGLLFLPLLFTNKNRKNLNIIAENSRFPNRKEIIAVLSTFMVTCFAWIFFRAESMTHALNYISHMSNFDLLLLTGEFRYSLIFVLCYILLMILFEWNARLKSYPFENSNGKVSPRWSYYFLIGTLMVINGHSEETFIYFQF